MARGPTWRDRVERVLAPEFLGELASRPIDDLRAARDECRAAGDDLSFIRRQVHGRLDIARWVLSRLGAGEDPPSSEELVANLDSILAGNVHAPGHQQMVESLEPPDLDELTEELDSLLPATWSLLELDAEQLGTWAVRLEQLEREYSGLRSQVFAREDAVKDEITRRLGEDAAAGAAASS